MKRLLLTAVAGLTLVLVTEVRADWFLNQEQEAYEHFQVGDYGQAADGFSDDYRRGVSLYKSGRFQEAADSFSRAANASSTPSILEDRITASKIARTIWL